MKRIVVVRHSKAEEHRSGLIDFERGLTERGVREAHLIAYKIKELGIFPDLLISSPANRGLHSCQLHAEEFGIPETEIITRKFIYNYFDIDDLVDLLEEVGKKSQTVFLFGHNPTFAELADELSQGFHHHLPTSGAVGVEFDIDNWSKLKRKTGRIIFFEYPKKYS